MARHDDRLNDIGKYIDYFLGSKGYTSDTQTYSLNEWSSGAALSARGTGRGPAIVIHGIMPRSGSVYVGELLRRHPDLFAFPYQLWEFPALQLVSDIRRLQEQFFRGYKSNRDKMAPDTFLPLVGSSLISYLYEPVPPLKRVLVKIPDVRYLSSFFTMFPNENLLILIRDGRDLVHSTLKTWPRLNFIQVCLRWNRSAAMVLQALRHFEDGGAKGYWLGRYEDALKDPSSFVKNLCHYFDLDDSVYPYKHIDQIRVIGSSKLEHDQQSNVTWRHIERPQDFRPVEYWKQWSPVKKFIFKSIAGRSLIQLGYCEDTNW